MTQSESTGTGIRFAGTFHVNSPSMKCPRCGTPRYQQRRWTPDLNPTRFRRQCFDCGWDSGWESKERPS